MSFTTDTGNLFQSDAQHQKAAVRAARAEALESVGNPIKLSTKPLSVVIRQPQTKGKRAEPEGWVAESGFVVRRVGLDSGKTKQLYKGHCGPVTSLDFYRPTTGTQFSRDLLISGSWDKTFRVWDVQTKTHLSTTIAHNDFVKALVVIPSLKVLVTGSSDKDLRVWDLAPLDSWDFASLATSTSGTSTPAEDNSEPTPPPQLRAGAAPPAAVSHRPLSCLLALKAHTRPIEQLAYYDLLESADDDDEQPRKKTGRTALLSADSMGALKIWELWREESGAMKGELRCQTRPHELAIYDMVVGEEGELWTASADHSVLLSSLSLSTPSTPPTPLLRLPHPSQVRSLLPLAAALPALSAPYLLTASSDELLRIFSLASSACDPDPAREQRREWRGIGLAEGSVPGGCVREVEGHTHEIVQLRAYVSEGTAKSQDGADEGGGKKREAWILSASLDGTLRRWKWPEMLLEERDRLVLVPVVEQEEGEKKKEGLLTEEEERELEELMADDE
ncbi:hypothetical protein JCM21900_004491 [Sporobolomyces salmonicolor]